MLDNLLKAALHRRPRVMLIPPSHQCCCQVQAYIGAYVQLMTARLMRVTHEGHAVRNLDVCLLLTLCMRVTM